MIVCNTNQNDQSYRESNDNLASISLPSRLTQATQMTDARTIATAKR